MHTDKTLVIDRLERIALQLEHHTPGRIEPGHGGLIRLPEHRRRGGGNDGAAVGQVIALHPGNVALHVADLHPALQHGDDLHRHAMRRLIELLRLVGRRIEHHHVVVTDRAVTRHAGHPGLARRVGRLAGGGIALAGRPQGFAGGHRAARGVVGSGPTGTGPARGGGRRPRGRTGTARGGLFHLRRGPGRTGNHQQAAGHQGQRHILSDVHLPAPAGVSSSHAGSGLLLCGQGSAVRPVAVQPSMCRTVRPRHQPDGHAQVAASGRFLRPVLSAWYPTGSRRWRQPAPRRSAAGRPDAAGRAPRS